MNKLRRVLVVGLDRVGEAALQELLIHKQKENIKVIAVDINEKIIEDFKNDLEIAVSFDAADGKEKNWEEAGIENIDVAIVAVGDIGLAFNQLIAVLRNFLKIPQIFVRSPAKKYEKALRIAGATEVFTPEDYVGREMARMALSPGTLDSINFGKDYRIEKIEAKGRKFIDKKIKEIEKEFKVNIVFIMGKTTEEESGEKVSDEIIRLIIRDKDLDYVIKSDDILGVAGSFKEMDSFKKKTIV